MASVENRVIQFIHDKIDAQLPHLHRRLKMSELEKAALDREKEIKAKINKQYIESILKSYAWVASGAKAHNQAMPTHEHKSGLRRVERAKQRFQRAIYKKDGTLREDLPTFWEAFEPYFKFSFGLYETKLPPAGPRTDIAVICAAQAAAQIFQKHGLTPKRADLVDLTNIIYGGELAPRAVACDRVFKAFFGKKARSRPPSANRARN
jgi:hypothetical protein